VGPPEAIYDNPTNRFVAGLFGSPPMNFLDVELMEDSGRLHVIREGFSVVLPPAIAQSVTASVRSGGAVLGVRPESIGLHAGPVERSILATVFLVEPAGHQLIVDARIGEAMVRVRADRDAEWIESLAPDAVVHLTVDNHRLHLFDRNSGSRLD
jgi:multiple sugar transport system ATP-binding protein